MGTLNKEIQKTIKVTVKKEVEEQPNVKMKSVERELDESLDKKWNHSERMRLYQVRIGEMKLVT